MQKVMVKVSHCTCSSRSSKHPLCSSYTSILLTTGISSELPVTRLHTSRPHRTCTRPQLGQLDHFKGMIDTKGGGLSLFPWDQDPEQPPGLDHFSCCTEATWGQTQRKEKREKKRSYGFSSGSSHTASWHPLQFLVQSTKQFPFCCNMLEFTNK